MRVKIDFSKGYLKKGGRVLSRTLEREVTTAQVFGFECVFLRKTFQLKGMLMCSGHIVFFSIPDSEFSRIEEKNGMSIKDLMATFAFAIGVSAEVLL